MKFSIDLQKLLPFGYLFLVVIGVLKESIFYYHIGINILKYSNIMDILISPIADITSTPIILTSLIVTIFIFYLIILYLSKNYHNLSVKKLIGAKTNFDELTESEIKNRFGHIFIAMLAIGMISFFLGVGQGRGKAVATKNEKGTLEYNSILTFNSSGPSENIYLIGTNSANAFYFVKGNKNVKISPMLSIKTIELMKKNTK